MNMLPNPSHASAQQLSVLAEQLLRDGKAEEAHAAYSQAAALEVAAFRQVARAHERTRGILAVSAAALYYKAAALEEAERFALELLVEASLPVAASDQLRETLQATWFARSLRDSGKSLSPTSVMVSLRGRDVGVGQAPLPLVIEKITGVNSLLFRITEWLGDFTFRTKGPPPEAVRNLCQPMVGEPSPGSFRFSIQIAEATQPELFRVRKVSAGEISSQLLDLISIISPPAVRSLANPNLDETISDSRYREVILKLVRNLTPDGTRISEMEFSTQQGDSTRTAILHSGARFRIDEHLRTGRDATPVETIAGTLRAVDLDRPFLEVVEESGTKTRLRMQHEILDDVIGPMINKRVLVTGQRYRQSKSLTLIDVELDLEVEGS